MATPVVPEPPRNGQYLPAYAFVKQEGGGDLHVNTVACDTCGSLVDEPQLSKHMTVLHQEASPKSR